ncbi:MAG: tRNA 2-thiouridine(34) synthase MnmA [Brevinematia bacterium]
MPVVYVGMSGGVDSSVSALLLKEQGYDVRGLTLILSGIEGERKCCSVDEVRYAGYVCKYLGIPHETLDLRELFRAKIINYFVREHLKGRTPNACVNCNLHFKFGYLLEYALSKGADFIATGHYAKVEKSGDQVLLKQAKDKSKDQSYFLARLNKFQLSKVIFPLADISKDEVKRIAKDANLPLKPYARESQDLCFIRNGDIPKFLIENGVEPREGIVVDERGVTIGKHKGIYFYTIGQRRGLEISLGRRVYLKHKDSEKNLLVVSESPYFRGFIGSNLNWIWDRPIQKGRFLVKVRYKSEGGEGYLELLDENRVRVIFDEKQFAITPGQLAVMYHNTTVVGSAFIDETIED